MKKSAYNGPEYRTEAHGSFPDFISYDEEAYFWDTQFITDFSEETEAVKVRATRGLSANVQDYGLVNDASAIRYAIRKVAREIKQDVPRTTSANRQNPTA